MFIQLKLMKRIIAICLCVCSLIFMLIGCSKKCVRNESEWEDVVQTYPFMDAFPSYDGEVEIINHARFMSMENLEFLDHQCPSSLASKYYDKLSSYGFDGVEGFDTRMYSKFMDGMHLTVSGSYVAGSFVVMFSVLPED